jgi:hypothetical protein
MAKAILTGKQIKEFSFQQSFTVYTFANAIVSGFAKNLFMRNCPCDARNGQRQYKEPKYLHRRYH